jgi:hypothetical protein
LAILRVRAKNGLKRVYKLTGMLKSKGYEVFKIKKKKNKRETT